jgi:hypothetical protein
VTGGQFPPAVGIYLEAERLRRTFPEWTFSVHVRDGVRTRIEAVNPASADLYAVISSNPADVWRELRKVHS